VKYLLDVNVLVALGLLDHVFHQRVAIWVQSSDPRNGRELLTCPITELGFVRVLSQASQYRITVSQAKSLLSQLKKSNALKLGFLADDHDASRLPAWVRTGGQTTDGHLLELARAHGALLATLDGRIPGAFVVPE
jgi:predicted nucleic acid-binding protein